VLGGHVDRVEVETAPAAHLDARREEVGGHGCALLAAQGEPGVRRAPGSRGVGVAVAVPKQVEPRARPELEQVERHPGRPRDRQEAGQEREAALDLVRLDGLLREEADDPVAVVLDRGPEVLPVARERVRRRAGELEIVDGAEELEREAPVAVRERE
jgi:hypothetical protein